MPNTKKVTEYPTDATSTELLRKAIVGEKNTSSANDAAYAQAIAYASTMSDIDKSNFIVNISQKQQAINDKANSYDNNNYSGLTNYDSFNKQQTQQDYYDSLSGGITSKYGAERAGLKSNLEYAKGEAEVQRRAEEAAELNRREKLYEEEYQSLERQKIIGSSRGLLPTRAQQGAELGITNYATRLRSESLIERDARISDIQSRIAALTNSTNIQLTQSKVNEQAELASAQAQANQFASQEEWNWRQMAFQEKLADLGFEQQKFLQKDAQEFSASESALSRQFTSEENELNRALEREGWDVRHRQTLEQMEKQHGYNISSIWSQASASDWASSKAHSRALQSALNEVTPGTPEYEIIERGFARTLEQNRQIAVQTGKIDLDAIRQQANLATELELKKYTPGTKAFTLAEAQGRASKNDWVQEQLLPTYFEIATQNPDPINRTFMAPLIGTPQRMVDGFVSLFAQDYVVDAKLNRYKNAKETGKTSATLTKAELDYLNNVYGIFAATGATEEQIYTQMHQGLKNLKNMKQ